MATAFPANVSVLRATGHKGGMLGLWQHDSSYVVGFTSREHATRVQRQYSEHSTMRLSRMVCEDLTAEVSKGLWTGHQLKIPVKQITVCHGCKLHITKRVNINHVQPIVEVAELPFENLLMHPFKYNVGVVLALDTIPEEDTNDEFAFECHVIQPSPQEALIRRVLDKL